MINLKFKGILMNIRTYDQMSRNKSVAEKLRNYLSNAYNDFYKDDKKYRCKIVNLELKDNDDVVLFVKISAVKSSVVSFSPEELVLSDKMLREFSSIDARTITFFALQKEKNSKLESHTHFIRGQEFDNGKTIFITQKLSEEGERKQTAFELYSNAQLLNQFNRADTQNIIVTAIQEQVAEDFDNIG